MNPVLKSQTTTFESVIDVDSVSSGAITQQSLHASRCHVELLFH